MSTRLDEARHMFGTIFSSLQQAREMVNSARYEVEDGQALKEEDIRRWQAISEFAQKVIVAWEEVGRPV